MHQPDMTTTSDVMDSRATACTPSLDNPHFESLLLRLHSAIDVPGFWSAVQSILDEVVPNDACVVCLNYVDFSRTWDASMILTTPNAQRPNDWLQQRRDVDMTRAFILSNPGIKQYQLSDVEPDAHKLQHSEFFRRHMASEGWRYTACSLFWQQGRLHSEISIRRTAEQGDFTRHEMALLNRLHPHIETTLGRLSAVEAITSRDDRLPATNASLQTSFNRLTPAERVIVALVREGCSNKEIASRLGKSVRTVKTQLTSIYKKFDVRSRSKLLARVS